MTNKEYAIYREKVHQFFDDEGLQNLSYRGEPFFSWCDCECCGDHLGGDRYEADGYCPKEDSVKEFTVCTDCIYFADYGSLDDMTMLDIDVDAIDWFLDALPISKDWHGFDVSEPGMVRSTVAGILADAEKRYEDDEDLVIKWDHESRTATLEVYESSDVGDFIHTLTGVSFDQAGLRLAQAELAMMYLMRIGECDESFD